MQSATVASMFSPRSALSILSPPVPGHGGGDVGVQSGIIGVHEPLLDHHVIERLRCGDHPRI